MCGGAYFFIHCINVSTILHWNVFTFTTEYGEQYQLETERGSRTVLSKLIISPLHMNDLHPPLNSLLPPFALIFFILLRGCCCLSSLLVSKLLMTEL